MKMPLWFDRLIGRPSLEDLTDRVRAGLVSMGKGPVAVQSEGWAVQYGPGPTQLNLHNLYVVYQRSPSRARPQVVKRFLQELSDAMGQPVPRLYSEVRSRLMPILLPAKRAAANAEERQTDFKGENPRLPYAPSLDVVLAIDSQESLMHVTSEHLATWQVRFEAAVEDAIDNLRARSTESFESWTSPAPGVLRGPWNDAYDSSRLLLPDVIYRAGIANPVVMVPARGVLLLAARHDEAALASMAAHVTRTIAEETRRLTPLLYSHQGSKCEVVSPPGRAAPAFASLGNVFLAPEYAAQRQNLQKALAEKGSDVFVADATTRQHPDGSLRTYAVWTECLNTALPSVSTIFINPVGADGTRDDATPFATSWAAFVAEFHDVIEPMNESPERWLLMLPSSPGWNEESARRVARLRDEHFVSDGS